MDGGEPSRRDKQVKARAIRDVNLTLHLISPRSSNDVQNLWGGEALSPSATSPIMALRTATLEGLQCVFCTRRLDIMAETELCNGALYYTCNDGRICLKLTSLDASIPLANAHNPAFSTSLQPGLSLQQLCSFMSHL